MIFGDQRLTCIFDGIVAYYQLLRPITACLGGERAAVATGLKIALPAGTEGQVRPRSGLAITYGITVLNAPGTIDEGYRGEVKVLLINHGQEPFEIRKGMRIAQLVIAPVRRVALEEGAVSDHTVRGAGGFDSSGC